MTDFQDRFKQGLLQWYPFSKDATRLVYQDGERPKKDGVQFDYIVCDRGLEKEKDPVKTLEIIYSMLSPSGTLLLCVNNRLGIRYFIGDRDPYSGNVFDGVDNYSNLSQEEENRLTGHMYSKAEIGKMLDSAGFRYRFYSVLSDLDHPFHIIREDYMPNEDLTNRVLPTYNDPSTVFIHEEKMYTNLMENGLFHIMANAYIVECRKDDSFANEYYITQSLDRDEAHSVMTILFDDGHVEKRAVYDDGMEGLKTLKKHMDMLSERGIKTVEMSLTSNGIAMPLINAQTTHNELLRLFYEDQGEFFKLLDRFVDKIKQSSEISRVDEKLGPIMKTGFIDMVPLNSLFVDGDIVFIDQEFVIPEYPLNAIISRIIQTLYAYHNEMENVLTRDQLYEYFGILDNKETYINMERDFLGKLKNVDRLNEHWKGCVCTQEEATYNREKINGYSAAKPYHIGYVAGAFDMFHIGHLNLLRRAKEKCDYLVAGVISDERVFELKKRNPVIPCNERMQVVAGCRYVDEVIELPLGGASIRDAYERVHFDCMFSGDDHANDPGWLMEQEYLRSLGSDIVFVSYTKETSSTDIRKKISQRNLELTTEKNYKWIYTYDYAPESVWEPWRDEVYKGSGENVDNRERKPTPAWITKEAENVVSRLKEYVPAYILLADSHFTYNGTWEDTLASMKAVSERTKVEGIIHLGDMTDGLLPLKKTSEIEKGCIEDMESLGADLYLLPGNHDYNYFRENPEIKYPETPQYYIDNIEQKIRLIFIDSFDPKEEVRYGFTKECIIWLDKTLEALPDDYNAIIFSHLTPLVRLQAWTKDIRNRNDLIAVMDKYADRILAFINGHNHCDHIFNDLKNGKFPIISINCSKCEYFTEHKPAGAIVPERRLGDRTQESFDIMQIDPDKKEIYFTRFGAGQDRIIKGGKGYFI